MDFSSFKLFASGVCVRSVHVGRIPHSLGSCSRREQSTVLWCVWCHGRVPLTAPYGALPSGCCRGPGSLGLFCTLLAGWLIQRAPGRAPSLLAVAGPHRLTRACGRGQQGQRRGCCRESEGGWRGEGVSELRGVRALTLAIFMLPSRTVLRSFFSFKTTF